MIILISCPSFSYADGCDSVSAFQWLLGNWASNGEKSIVLESWTTASDHTFEGSGETRSKTTNELISSESLRLVEMSGEIFYIAKVAHNDRPIAFKLSHCTDNSSAFENPDHDFPKRIEYRVDHTNTLVVTVSDGKEEGFSIKFLKQEVE